jgi:hypothetical protein
VYWDVSRYGNALMLVEIPPSHCGDVLSSYRIFLFTDKYPDNIKTSAASRPALDWDD